MSRLIDADEFKRYADKPSIFDTTDLKEMINEQPTVDAVEVVRCKDCIYYKQGAFKEYAGGLCNYHHLHMGDSDYCSYGERR